MPQTTSQQLIDSLGYEGGRVGQPLVVTAGINQSIGAKSLISVPVGHVFLITQVVLQADPGGDTNNSFNGSPTTNQVYLPVELFDADGTQQPGMTFRAFSRNINLFNDSATPDWRTAVAGPTVTWKPKHPIPIPGSWEVRTKLQTSSTHLGNSVAIYGVMVSESSARTMNISAASDALLANRNNGIASSAGSAIADTASEMIAGRPGRCIHVIDVNFRCQPSANVSNTVTLHQSAATGGGQVVFKSVNDNPAEFVDMSFSPGWFLKAGEPLEITSNLVPDDAALSVNLTYEYVSESEVPGDYWFSVVTPDKPSPGNAQGLANLLVGTSTIADLYYPRRDELVSVAPSKGITHFVNGVSFFVQKTLTTQNVTDDTEQTRITVSSGATGGDVDVTALQVSQTNYQMTHVISASGHDQCTWGLIDGVNIPGVDAGAIWVDALGINSIGAAPTADENDVRDWAVNLWGRTGTSFPTPRTNRGQ